MFWCMTKVYYIDPGLAPPNCIRKWARLSHSVGATTVSSDASPIRRMSWRPNW
jgi:hypothetical protein